MRVRLRHLAFLGLFALVRALMVRNVKSDDILLKPWHEPSPWRMMAGVGGRNYVALRRRQRMNFAVSILHCLLGAYVLMWAVLVWFL